MKDVLQKTAENQKSRGHLDPGGFDRHIQFHTFAPPTDLAPFLEHFWTLSWDETDAIYNSEQLMHRPYTDVFISKDWSGVQGTYRGKRTYIASGSGRIVGARFLPGAFHAFWKGNMTELQDDILNITQFFPEMNSDHIKHVLAQDDQTIIHQLASLLRAKSPKPDKNIALINEIIAATEHNDDLQTVSAIAEAYGKSERWLQQLFQEYVGVGLKWLLRRNKLLSAAEEIRESDQPQWTAIAYNAGYSSQQHFITDFKKVLGKTPLQYKKELDTDTKVFHVDAQ